MTYLKVIMCKEYIVEAKFHFGKPSISSLNCQILILFVFWLPSWLLEPIQWISDLKVICAQSCCNIEVLWALRRAKTCSQQPCSWFPIPWNTLYMHTAYWEPYGGYYRVSSIGIPPGTGGRRKREFWLGLACFDLSRPDPAHFTETKILCDPKIRRKLLLGKKYS